MCVNVLLTGLLVLTPLLKFTFFCVSIIKIQFAIYNKEKYVQSKHKVIINGCSVTKPILLNCTL